jgi:hypothetical protein
VLKVFQSGNSKIRVKISLSFFSLWSKSNYEESTYRPHSTVWFNRKEISSIFFPWWLRKTISTRFRNKQNIVKPTSSSMFNRNTVVRNLLWSAWISPLYHNLLSHNLQMHGDPPIQSNLTHFHVDASTCQLRVWDRYVIPNWILLHQYAVASMCMHLSWKTMREMPDVTNCKHLLIYRAWFRLPLPFTMNRSEDIG